jgi:hypothetical protein
MAMIRLFYDELNNWEKALLTWVGIIFLSLIVYKNIRPHILKLFGIFLTGKLGLAIYIGICYVLIMIYGLILVGFWEPSLLKDSIFWLAVVAFPLFRNYNSIKSTHSLIDILKHSLRWTILVEFINNMHVFSYVAELFIIPILLSIQFIKLASEKIPQGNYIRYPLNFLLGIIVTTLLYHSFSSVFQHPKEFFNLGNLKLIFISPVLTALFLPYLYFLAVRGAYEQLNMRIGFLTKDKLVINALKKRSFRKAGLDLGKINKLENQAILLLYWDL